MNKTSKLYKIQGTHRGRTVTVSFKDTASGMYHVKVNQKWVGSASTIQGALKLFEEYFKNLN